MNGNLANSPLYDAAGKETVCYEVDHLVTFEHSGNTITNDRVVRQLENLHNAMVTTRCLLVINSVNLMVIKENTQEILKEFSLDSIRSPGSIVRPLESHVYDNLVFFGYPATSGGGAIRSVMDTGDLHVFRAVAMTADVVAKGILQASKHQPITSFDPDICSTRPIKVVQSPFRSPFTGAPLNHPLRHLPNTNNSEGRPSSTQEVCPALFSVDNRLLGHVETTHTPPRTTETPDSFTTRSSSNPSPRDDWAGRLPPVEVRAPRQPKLASTTGNDNSHAGVHPQENISFQRDLDLFQMCYSDIRKFIDQMNRDNRTIYSVSDYVICLKKFKVAFILLARLQGHIHRPNAADHMNVLIGWLQIVSSAADRSDPDKEHPLCHRIVSPLLTKRAIVMLQHGLKTKDHHFWKKLGEAWCLTKSEYPSEIPVLNLCFKDGCIFPEDIFEDPSDNLKDENGGFFIQPVQSYSAEDQTEEYPPVNHSSKLKYGYQPLDQNKSSTFHQQQDQQFHQRYSAFKPPSPRPDYDSSPVVTNHKNGGDGDGYSSSSTSGDPVSRRERLYDRPRTPVQITSHHGGHQSNVRRRVSSKRATSSEEKKRYQLHPQEQRHSGGTVRTPSSHSGPSPGGSYIKRSSQEFTKGYLSDGTGDLWNPLANTSGLQVEPDASNNNLDGVAAGNSATAAFLDDVRRRGGILYMAVEARTATNRKELNIDRGEILEVIESSRQWWKMRNCYEEEGFCPQTLLKLLSKSASQQIAASSPNRSPRAPMNYVIPAPPPLPVVEPSEAIVLRRPKLLSENRQTIGGEEGEKTDALLDELRRRIQSSSGASALTRRRTMSISMSSTPSNIRQWLASKQFTEKDISALSKLSGSKLMTRSLEDLEDLMDKAPAFRLFNLLTDEKKRISNGQNNYQEPVSDAETLGSVPDFQPDPYASFPNTKYNHH